MYESFYGFCERPFQLTPNPRFLFLNPGYREALATLRYGLTSSLGITVLSGETGTGKTTLLRAALQAERSPEHHYALVSNPTLSPSEFFEILAETFNLRCIWGSKARFLMAFERTLLELNAAGGRAGIVIDEAQSLSYELFEEIRLLANLETETSKLVNVILVGQPELAERLNDPSLRQFKQRVILRCSLPPLDLQGTASYIAARLKIAGVDASEIFTRDAVAAIYEASRGIPRIIGVVCENALLAGYAAQRKPVDPRIVIDVCRDLDLPVNGHGQRFLGAARAASDEAKARTEPQAHTATAAEVGDASPGRLASRWGSARFWSFSPARESRPASAAERSEGTATTRRKRTRFF